MKCAIIGGGMAGLGAAYELSKAGHDIVLIERGEKLGGLAVSIEVNGTPLEAYYHHMFPTYHDMVEVAEEAGVGDAVFFKKARMGTFFDGTLFPFNGPFDLLRFTPLSFVNRIRTGLGLLYLKLIKNYERFEGMSATAWLKKIFGTQSYEVIWDPLLRSKFGDKVDEISMVWLWGRIYERPTTFGYFRGGFQVFVDAVEKKLSEYGAEIQKGVSVQDIQKQENGQFVVHTTDGEVTVDHVVVTTPPKPFASFASSILPQEYKTMMERLDYHGAICAVLVLKKKLTDYYWININDKRFPFVVLVDHTNFVPASEYGGMHPLYMGKYLDTNDDMYKKTNEELLELFITKLKEINPAFDESWIEKKYIFKAPFAQPIVRTDHHTFKPEFKTPVPGLWWASMSHIYPWDRGVNHSLRCGREAGRYIMEQI